MATVFKCLYLAAAKSTARKLPLVGSYRVRTVESVFGCGWLTPPQAGRCMVPPPARLLLLPPPPPPVPALAASSAPAMPSLDDLLPPIDWDEEFEELSEPASATTIVPTETASPSPGPSSRLVHHHNFLGEPVYYNTWNSDDVTRWAIELAEDRRIERQGEEPPKIDRYLRVQLLRDLAYRTVGWVSVEDYHDYLVQRQALENGVGQV